MSMRKILIIEDEYFSAKRLKKLIMSIDDTVITTGPLGSVVEVASHLSEHNDYDLIFSDIRLTDGDVFEAFRQVKPRCFVIFTTAYDEYAMQAIKNNGLDYLMKPIDFDELCAAVRKMELMKPEQKETALRQLDGVLSDTHHYRERILVSAGDNLKILYTDDINYISVEDGHLLAFTDDGLSNQLPMTMAELEDELDPDKFFRINRQYIANIKGIKKISLFFNSKLRVRLKGCPDENITVSKEKSAQLRKWLDM